MRETSVSSENLKNHPLSSGQCRGAIVRYVRDCRSSGSLSKLTGYPEVDAVWARDRRNGGNRKIRSQMDPAILGPLRESLSRCTAHRWLQRCAVHSSLVKAGPSPDRSAARSDCCQQQSDERSTSL